MLSWIHENNVISVWIIGVIDEFGRKKDIVVVPMEIGSSGKVAYGLECFEYCIDYLECL